MAFIESILISRRKTCFFSKNKDFFCEKCIPKMITIHSGNNFLSILFIDELLRALTKLDLVTIDCDIGVNHKITPFSSG